MKRKQVGARDRSGVKREEKQTERRMSGARAYLRVDGGGGSEEKKKKTKKLGGVEWGSSSGEKNMKEGEDLCSTEDAMKRTEEVWKT